MPANQHDQNFKNLILDYPREALRFFAAEEAVDIDEQVVITPMRQEQLKARLGERFRELDVPLLVEWPDGRREALLFALEEESDPRHFSIHRLAHYCLDLAELCDTQRVVPVVIFLRAGKAVPEALRLGSERHDWLRFHYLSCWLAQIPAAEHLDSDNLVARLNLPNMAVAGLDKVEIFANAIKGLLSLEKDPRRQLKYLEFIDIYAALSDNDKLVYQQRYPEENTIMIGIVGQAREEGVQQGLQQGIEQGRQQGLRRGQAQLLLRLIQRRFGEVAPETRQRIEQASSAELEQWAENVLDAKRLEDVFSQR